MKGKKDTVIIEYIPKPYFGPIDVTRKSGLEEFTYNGHSINEQLLDYWRWPASDLVSNAMRGIIAEFLVACDLGVADNVRAEWDPWDLMTKSGVKVEVKSSAYCQSWYQKRHSPIIFGIGPTYGWDYETNTFGKSKRRQADVYVFCVLKH